jgi:aminopeptidase YwaD
MKIMKPMKTMKKGAGTRTAGKLFFMSFTGFMIFMPIVASQIFPSQQLPPAVLRAIDPVIDAAWAAYDMTAATGHVQFVSQFWRLPGNAGYDATLDRVAARLEGDRASFYDSRKKAPGTFFDEYANTGRGWDHSIGTLAIVHPGAADEIVLSREKERLALCINSFSTVPGGVTAPLVDVGRGQDADFANKEIKGAVVLGDAAISQLWQRGVAARGALGVVSTSLASYVNPDPPGAKPTPRDQWDILQWGGIPYEETIRGFGFKATPRAATTMRKALASSGRVQVHVTIASTFSTKPVRTLVAEIPGTIAPNERIVMAAHVQEPGANDNASGVATLVELAHALAAGIRSGRIPAPARTLTFLWMDEIGGSRHWLADHPEEAKGVRYMFSMDMPGEDVSKTGGSFLIERWPDPGAVWDRPWDPHSEWGRGNVRADQLKGDLINDVHLAICERVARKSNWIVRTNPYEGGSDHTEFGRAGIPSVLDWHFTDRYYHTNMDTADKSSGAEMRNVGVAVTATAWLLASANESMSLDVATFVANAGQARVSFEESEGRKLAAVRPDPATTTGPAVLPYVPAWKKWYAEAVRSVSRLVVGSSSPGFNSKLEELAAAFKQ